MQCRKARKLIFDYLDHLLNDKERVDLEAHLEECRSCELEAKDLAGSLELLHGLPEVQPGENFNWKVRLALARERRSMERNPSSQAFLMRRWNLKFSVAALASFVMVLFSGYFILQHSLMAPSSTDADPMISHANVPSLGERTGRNEYTKAPVTVSRRGFGERLVSEGYGTAGGVPDTYNPIEEEKIIPPSNPDSLIVFKLHEMRWRYRVKRLEQQIELLQMYLRNCQMKQARRN